MFYTYNKRIIVNDRSQITDVPKKKGHRQIKMNICKTIDLFTILQINKTKKKILFVINLSNYNFIL